MSDSMVKSAADYEYVTGANVDDEHPHGDLDRIQIDGNIMPVRGDNAVRGEDIAFLMEFGCQRYNMVEEVWCYDPGTGGLTSSGKIYDTFTYPSPGETFSIPLTKATWGDSVSGGVYRALRGLRIMDYGSTYSAVSGYSKLFYSADEAYSKWSGLYTHLSDEVSPYNSKVNTLSREDVSGCFEKANLFRNTWCKSVFSPGLNFVDRGVGFRESHISSGEKYADYAGINYWGCERWEHTDLDGIYSMAEGLVAPPINNVLCKVKTHHVMECKLACCIRLKYNSGNGATTLSRGYVLFVDMDDLGDGVFSATWSKLPDKFLNPRPENIGTLFDFTPTTGDMGYPFPWTTYCYQLSLSCYPVFFPDWHTLWV